MRLDEAGIKDAPDYLYKEVMECLERLQKPKDRG